LPHFFEFAVDRIAEHLPQPLLFTLSLTDQDVREQPEIETVAGAILFHYGNRT
jgi:hypothetical protein